METPPRQQGHKWSPGGWAGLKCNTRRDKECRQGERKWGRNKVVCKRWTRLKVNTRLINMFHAPTQEVAQLVKSWLEGVQHLTGVAEHHAQLKSSDQMANYCLSWSQRQLSMVDYAGMGPRLATLEVLHIHSLRFLTLKDKQKLVHVNASRQTSLDSTSDTIINQLKCSNPLFYPLRTKLSIHPSALVFTWRQSHKSEHWPPLTESTHDWFPSTQWTVSLGPVLPLVTTAASSPSDYITI